MPKVYSCNGCIHLDLPIGSPEFKEYCEDCRIADVEDLMNSVLPFGTDVHYIRTNYRLVEGEK